MDITETLAPASDQLDAVDLTAPRTFTVGEVTKGNAEQPVNVRLVEFPRVWRPGKSMRRVLAKVWGTDASKWAGRKVTLYCDETVKFAGEAVGGVRISHMSGIAKPVKVPLIISRGKNQMWTVQPLPDSEPVSAAPDRVTAAQKSALSAQIERLALTKDDYLEAATTAAGRIIAATDELTTTEADALLADLTAREAW